MADTINKKLVAEDMETVVLLRGQGGGGDVPISNHNDLSNRGDNNCHPISAITNLENQIAPPCTAADAGKVLRVTASGTIGWDYIPSPVGEVY